jgi:hypothetical protein
MVIDLDDHLDRRRRPRLVGNTAMLGWKTRSAPRLFAGDMVTQSMLPVPSPHARIAPAGAQTRFRGWDSDPPRAVLHLSHTKATLQPGALQWPKFASRGRTRPQSLPEGRSWQGGATPSVERAVSWEGSACIGRRDPRGGSRTVQVASTGSPSSSPPGVRSLAPVLRWSGEPEAPLHGKGTYPIYR